jgi:rfaE bifunctional protein kinase chain/domain
MLIARSVHPLPGEAERRERLLALIDGFSNRRILVVGDLIADEFIYGQVTRISREAPVLILKYDATEVVPGGAGNAANNVASLGGSVRVVGAVGDDAEGRRLLSSFHPNVERTRVARVSDYRTPVKTRILAGGVHSAKQQVVRIDRESGWPVSAAIAARVASSALAALGECDAVLLSDYGSGLVAPAVAVAIHRALSARGRRRPVPVLVDSRYALLGYRRLTACAPNEAELEQALGVRINDDPEVLERSGREVLKRTGMQAVLVTRGSRGMALFQPRRETVHIPIFGTDEIADVTGAGDTVMAALVLALAAGASFYEAAKLANYAGGLVVMKRGTATVSAGEIAGAVERDHQPVTERGLDETAAHGADVNGSQAADQRDGSSRRSLTRR